MTLSGTENLVFLVFLVEINNYSSLTFLQNKQAKMSRFFATGSDSESESSSEEEQVIRQPTTAFTVSVTDL